MLKKLLSKILIIKERKKKEESSVKDRSETKRLIDKIWEEDKELFQALDKL